METLFALAEYLFKYAYERGLVVNNAILEILSLLTQFNVFNCAVHRVFNALFGQNPIICNSFSKVAFPACGALGGAGVVFFELLPLAHINAVQEQILNVGLFGVVEGLASA